MDDEIPIPESRTAKALHKQRQAQRKLSIANAKGPGGCFERRMAELLNEEADALLAVEQVPIIAHGEVVTQEPGASLPIKRECIRDTLKQPSYVGLDASISRTDLLLLSNLDVVSLAVDAAESIGAENSIEKMLAHQMALAHELAFRMGNAAAGEIQRMEGPRRDPQSSIEAQRLTNAATRLMDTSQRAALALQKIRSGGNQTVTVQHVTVQGGQTVIGNVQAGGKNFAPQPRNQIGNSMPQNRGPSTRGRGAKDD